MVALIKPSSGSRHWPYPREAYPVRSTGYNVHRPTHARTTPLFPLHPPLHPLPSLSTPLPLLQVSYLVGGENARIKLKDISDEDIQPGYVLSPRAGLACPTVRRFEVQLAVVKP